MEKSAKSKEHNVKQVMAFIIKMK